jgi:hypothetical protein
MKHETKCSTRIVMNGISFEQMCTRITLQTNMFIIRAFAAYTERAYYYSITRLQEWLIFIP